MKQFYFVNEYKIVTAFVKYFWEFHTIAKGYLLHKKRNKKGEFNHENRSFNYNAYSSWNSNSAVTGYFGHGFTKVLSNAAEKQEEDSFQKTMMKLFVNKNNI